VLKVLILGGTGMLGHKLWQTLAPRFDAYVTFRRAPEAYGRLGIFDPARALGGVCAEDFDSVTRAFDAIRPDVVVNAVGIVKQDATAKDPVASITVNALFPHLLARRCRAAGARLIHLSTDCVFSGRRGAYRESDAPDAEDLYGRSKLLGEVEDGDCLTIRTSMIGRELEGAQGLLEWFLGQDGGRVRGFRRAVFSGFTTAALAVMMSDLIASHPDLRGLYHVAAAPITKFDLLSLVKEELGLHVVIEPDETFVCDRSLDGTRFREATGFTPPSWPEMIAALRRDPTPYDDLRKRRR
jgi:dTDP-4-dehydrorhamnose reductase